MLTYIIIAATYKGGILSRLYLLLKKHYRNAPVVGFLYGRCQILLIVRHNNKHVNTHVYKTVYLCRLLATVATRRLYAHINRVVEV